MLLISTLEKWTVCNGICISIPRCLCVYTGCLCGSSIEHMVKIMKYDRGNYP